MALKHVIQSKNIGIMSDGNNNEIEIEATPDENEKKEIIPDENEIEKKETITGDDPLTYSQIYYRTNIM